ncbi:MAG: cytochrome c [Planctomycetales bacterium]|nr:cytochrome c [Planctomycetales bacterium]
MTQQNNLFICGLACALLLAPGCNQQKHANISTTDLYRLHCSGCHGDGTGNGHIAQTLKTRPRNLQHKEWQSSVSDEHIQKVIRDGGLSAKLSEEMPAFATKLTEQQIAGLTQYIRRLGM